MIALVLSLVLVAGPTADEDVDALVARLEADGDWWEARDELRALAADGFRLEILRALHDAWITRADAEVRRRNELVREEVNRDWFRAERQAELDRRVAACHEAALAFEPGVPPTEEQCDRLRETQASLRVALETTPNAIATQGYLPFGPAGPEPVRERRAHADGEAIGVTDSDGTVHEAFWRDGRLVLEVDGIEVVLVTPEEENSAEYRNNASKLHARRGPPPPFTEDERGTAIVRGLEYLAATQGSDGAWPAPPHNTHDRIFDTAVAGLAFLAAGDTIEQGEFRESVRRVRDYLLARIPEQGPLAIDAPGHEGWADFETWYLAFAGLFLAECSEQPSAEALSGLERIRRRLGVLVRRTGGWNHDHDFRLVRSGSSEYAHYSEDLLVVTNFVVPVVFSAEQLPPGTSLRATRAYYARLQNEDGGFAYGNLHGWAPSHESEAGRTAGALLALRDLGLGDTPGYVAAREYLRANLDLVPASPTHGGGLFPINYLSGAAGALQDPELWSLFRLRYFGELLATQRDDGSFLLDTGAWDTPVMGTGIALTTLLLEEGNLEILLAR